MESKAQEEDDLCCEGKQEEREAKGSDERAVDQGEEQGEEQGGGEEPECVDDGGGSSSGGADTSVSIMIKLEDFFSGNPDLSVAIGDFFAANASRITVHDSEREQSMEAHGIYLEYCDIIENGLEEFLARENVPPEDFVAACQDARDNGDFSTSALDYTIASTEYESFLDMCRDFSAMGQWTVEPGDYADCELEGALE